MQIIIVKSEDLRQEKSRKINTRICAAGTKRKETDKALNRIAKELGVDGQWNSLRDKGVGEAGGFRHSFVIRNLTEGVLYMDSEPLEAI